MGFWGAVPGGFLGGRFGRFFGARGGTITIHRSDYKRFRSRFWSALVSVGFRGGAFGRFSGPGAERLPSIGTIISVFGVVVPDPHCSCRTRPDPYRTHTRPSVLLQDPTRPLPDLHSVPHHTSTRPVQTPHQTSRPHCSSRTRPGPDLPPNLHCSSRTLPDVYWTLTRLPQTSRPLPPLQDPTRTQTPTRRSLLLQDASRTLR